jgi:hypothetical protein
MKIHQDVSVTAPAQVANIFGYFDCAGFLYKPPPQNESDIGGVGDVITVQFGDGGPSSIRGRLSPCPSPPSVKSLGDVLSKIATGEPA